MTYILLATLLFLGSVYNTGLRLGCICVVGDAHVISGQVAGRSCKTAGKSVEKFKPRLKVRYRASEVKLELCGIGHHDFAKPLFSISHEFFENYSFHTLSYLHDIKLRGPPAGCSC